MTSFFFEDLAEDVLDDELLEEDEDEEEEESESEDSESEVLLSESELDSELDPEDDSEDDGEGARPFKRAVGSLGKAFPLSVLERFLGWLLVSAITTIVSA